MQRPSDTPEGFRPLAPRPEPRFTPMPALDRPRPEGFSPHPPQNMARPRIAPAPPAPPEPPVTAPEPPKAPPPQPRPDPMATRLEEARAEALAEGRAQGLAEAQAALATETAATAALARSLSQALARLADPPAAEVEALALALDHAIARLAAERAGRAIDAAPAHFARRVARLAERVARDLREVSVLLHPDDLAAIRPLLTEACAPDLAALASARLVAAPDLMRGDADLRAPGLRLADLLIVPAGEAVA